MSKDVSKTKINSDSSNLSASIFVVIVFIIISILYTKFNKDDEVYIKKDEVITINKNVNKKIVLNSNKKEFSRVNIENHGEAEVFVNQFSTSATIDIVNNSKINISNLNDDGFICFNGFVFHSREKCLDKE